ncbi:hypothetical protein ACFLZG_06895, partial [Thermodesulfobacteriota bacterium]
AYGTVEDLRVHLGPWINTFNILSTHVEDTLVTSQGGDDVFRIGSDTDLLTDSQGTMNGVLGTLTLDTGTGMDVLEMDDGGDDVPNNVTLEAGLLTGFSAGGEVHYTGFDLMALRLGTGPDTIYIGSTSAHPVNVDTGDGDDIVNIGHISDHAVISTGAGDDILRVNYDQQGLQTFTNGIEATQYLSGLPDLELYGGGDSDIYEIGLSGEGSARIKVSDTTTSGINRLNIYGTDNDDFFLFRPGAIIGIEVDPEFRLPVPDGGVERIDYDASLSGGGLFLYGREGNDSFIFDDNSIPMTVYGDAGDDLFQIGQIFQSARDGSNLYNGLLFGDYFLTTHTTRGYLSNGVSFPTTMYGGTGNDNFTVYRNLAEIFLFGEEDDDAFRVRAFVKIDPTKPKKPFTNINGGQGADFIEYTVNAPVNVQGGDGFDTLNVLGTEFGDDFVITESGVFGSGLTVRYGGIEKVTVDGLEGNDTFFIAGTPEGTQIEIVGGLGSDTFNVAGGTDDGTPITVVGNGLGGHSGLIDQSIDNIQTVDNSYDGLFVDDVSAVVADNEEPGIIILPENDPMRLTEGSDNTIKYRVLLTQAPENDVRVFASPSLPKEADRAAGALGLVLNGSELGATLLFTRNDWHQPKFIILEAPDDFVTEGLQTITIQHSVSEGGDATDGDPYDGIQVATISVKVVDDDAASVILTPTEGETLVFEQWALIRSDTYNIELAKPPAEGATVTIRIQTDGQVLVRDQADPSIAPSQQIDVVFSDTDLRKTIEVFAFQDDMYEGIHYSRITHEVISPLDAYFNITKNDVLYGLAEGINGNLQTNLNAEADTNANIVTIRGPAFEIDTDVDDKVHLDAGNSTMAWEYADITFSGTVNPGELWILELNGTEYRYEVRQTDTSVDEVVAGLATEIDTDFDNVSSTGSTLSVTDGSPFSVFATLEAGDTITLAGNTSSSHYQVAVVTATVTEPVVDRTEWRLDINGENYSYVAGQNGEMENFPGLDVKITDDEVVGVLVTQSDGQTVVIEPTDQAVIGTGTVTEGIDRSNFIANFGTSVMFETDIHDSYDTAQNLDFGSWSDDSDPDIQNSTTIPHISIMGTGDNRVDFYKFTIDSAMLVSDDNVTAIFDIDHGFEYGEQVFWASQLSLFNEEGVRLDYGPGYSNPGTGGSGSTTWLDDYMTYTFTQADLGADESANFYLKVDNW